MKNTTKFLMIFITIAYLSSCNEKPVADASTADSASVKRMSTDSNSDMPVHTPNDSMEKMPNSLDSTKKPTDN